VPEILADSAVGRNARPARRRNRIGGRPPPWRRIGEGGGGGGRSTSGFTVFLTGEEAVAPELGNGQRAAAAEPPAGASLQNEDGSDRLRSADLGAGPV
jgi:hypothetical protein